MPPSVPRTSARMPRASIECAEPRCCQKILVDDVGGLLERRVGVAESDLVGGDDVARQLAADRRRGGGLADVGDERLDVIVDLDQRGGVLGDVAVVGDHHRDRLADIGHLAVGQREQPCLVERHPGVRVAHHAAAGHDLCEIVEREHGMHAGYRQRRVLADAADQRVRVRAAHERDVQHAGHRNVVDKAAPPAQQRLVFDAGDARADQGEHAVSFRSLRCCGTCRSSNPSREGAAGSPLPTRAKRVAGRGRGGGGGD